eukprot:gb/GEZJ01004030.1/.p1 GENE.gb/GEZJ01004030.1/~~gb/GEZJ01004030.1/.p1  ORF type:complete len:203 (-),score=35.06 gb/GEZJ01004030.1/:765-1373(-)
MAASYSLLTKTVLLLLLAAVGSVHAGRDYYDLLGVPRDASTSVIKKSYRQLAKMYHPDKHPGNKKYEKKFKDISTAYEVLSDEQQRRRYDQFGEAGLHNGAGGGGGGGGGAGGFHGFGGGHQFHRASYGGGFADFDPNMFADMFGGSFGGGGGGGGGGGSSFAFSGNNRRQRHRHPPPPRRICFQNKVCENNRCFSVKECTS